MKTTLFSALICWTVGNAAVSDPLPALDLEPDNVTVSGLSSGAFMAVQMQITYSSAITGAGVIAGGPFDCAENSLWRALYVCMDPFWRGADAERSVASIRDMARDNRIDPLEQIAPDRVYLFHGRSDDTVDRPAMDALRDSYVLLGVSPDRLAYVSDVDAGHGFVTERADLDCDVTAPDFLIDCDFDQAGAILNQLLPNLSPPEPADVAAFHTFDQSLYTEGASGLDTKGFVYVPEACRSGVTCQLHIAFHGCKQGREVMGEDFARLTGYNRWAEANRIVVLYPQAVAIPSPWYNWFAGNPNGCWDWWGYSGDEYLGKSAPQLSAVARMAAALGVSLSN